MSSEPAISLSNLGKCYQIYGNPRDRLLQALFRGRRTYYQEFWALKNIDLDILPGEVIGVIGSNGAGKSTLLQLVCGTLAPTTGTLSVKGRVAALLELGAGFNPEFTGRENVYLSAAVIGMSRSEVERRYDDIVAFSGIRDFIDQPVKTYSSGMYVRLAFSIAINVDPDILVIDEALSVGDGEFARKSFDRIMKLKEAGKTILFCSHSMYQVEAICNRVLWLNKGVAEIIGQPAEAIVAYNSFLDAQLQASRLTQPELSGHDNGQPQSGTARIDKVSVAVDGTQGTELYVRSGQSTLTITVAYRSDPQLPPPSVAVMITDPSAKPIASSGTRNDGVTLTPGPDGRGCVQATFEKLPLLKGSYWVYAFLMCENAVHFYETASMVATLHVNQQGLEVGLVALPHSWREL